MRVPLPDRRPRRRGPRRLWVGGIRMSTIATSGSSRSTSREQPAGVAGRLAADSTPASRQQPREALAEQRRVVGDHDAHGISTCRHVSRRRAGCRPAARPSSARARSASPRRPVPPSRRGAAAAVVADLDANARPFRVSIVTQAREALRVLGDVRQRLGDHEVDGRLDLGRAGAPRSRRPRRGRARARPACARRRRAPGRSAPPGGCRARARAARRAPPAARLRPRRAARPLGRPRRPCAVRRSWSAIPDAEQALLCAVVEVALEPAALLVAGLHDPRARLPQLGELRAQLGLKPLVLEREPRSRAGRLEQRRLVEQHRVVDDRGEVVAHEVTARSRPRRERDVSAVLVDPDAPLGQPQRQLEGRVADAPGRARRRTPPGPPLELDDEVADRSRGPDGSPPAR